MALGRFLLGARKRLEVSKYAISHYAPHNWQGRALNHVQIFRIESGERIAPEYETVRRIADGIDAASERGRLTPGERLAMFEYAFADRVTYEAAKFAVYYLYLLGETEGVMHPALEELRADIIAQGLAPGPEVAFDRPLVGLGGKKAHGPIHPAVNLATATGFDLVREMAEMPEAHHLRMGLLMETIPWLVMDWEFSQVFLGKGALRDTPAPPHVGSSEGMMTHLRGLTNGNGDVHIVRLPPLQTGG